MRFIDLLLVASVPVVKVLLVTGVGLFLALDGIDILGENARHHLNKVVFFVFSPSLIASNLAKTLTFQTFRTLWFMPVNILITFVIGSILGWLLLKLTRPPKHLKGLIIGACSGGNMGNLPIILVPAMCKEKGSPFGPADVCETYALSYASLSMAIGAVYLWSYVYNVVRISAEEVAAGEIDANYYSLVADSEQRRLIDPSSKPPVSLPQRMSHSIRSFLEKANLKAVLAPSTIAAILGFAIGMISPIRNLMIGNDAPFHVVTDSAFMLGEAAIPALTVILGANLLQGLRGSGIQLRVVIGIVVVRFIILPLLGILIVKGALRVGLVPYDDKLFVFLLLIQYAMPPAMNIGTMTQLFGAGQSECSVIMLWTYALASVSLTLWSTLFLWIVT
ncbi:protein PIN-LIKES 1 isoform X1 [Spinacia oleracea]|uniref:Protein PIN-LIKES 1 isoform X1 n=1 Tax=Spinacia oleracea TaxID=3562 RepID=A0A9R0KB17_SPIOL|nr:protein PIN-LIKES 1-like isoform X1 [Spinacia oleracea]